MKLDLDAIEKQVKLTAEQADRLRRQLEHLHGEETGIFNRKSRILRILAEKEIER